LATPTKPPALRATAIRMLARRDYGRAELAQRLAMRGGSREEIERTLDDLERSGYLSDARFAQTLVDRKAGRYGKEAIAHELKEKRVAPEAAAEALATLAAGDELTEATAQWQRRFGVAPANDREKARQLRFLRSRGYSTSVAWKVLRAASADDNA
jgi:regulatory protein